MRNLGVLLLAVWLPASDIDSISSEVAKAKPGDGLRAFGKNEIVMGSRTSNKLTSNLNGGMPPESPRGDRADAVTAQSHAT
ncbi:MAG TPA: hypothetical protein VH643_23490, partial [Gemmataceae bacterium]